MATEILIKPDEVKSVSTNQMSREEIELLKTTICKGGTDEDLKLLIHACNRMGLDPFMRQIYSVARKDYKTGQEVRTIQTGIDGYRLIAERTGKYMPGKECTYTYKDNTLFSATAYVKKMGPDGQWHEIAHTAFWSEYAQMKDGKPVGMWRNMPHVMLGKCAEAACLRRAFPADLSGIYTKEEMDQADVEPVVTPPNPEKKHQDKADPVEPKDQKDIFEEVITLTEAEEIESAINPEDKEYRANLLNFFGSRCNKNLSSFVGLPRYFHKACWKSILERQKTWMIHKEKEEIPF